MRHPRGSNGIRPASFEGFRVGKRHHLFLPRPLSSASRRAESGSSTWRRIPSERQMKITVTAKEWNQPDMKRLERSCQSALRVPSRGVSQGVRPFQSEAEGLREPTGGMAVEDGRHGSPVRLFSREWSERLHAVSERRESRAVGLGSPCRAIGGVGPRLCGDGVLWSAVEEMRDIWNVGTIQRLRSRCPRSLGNGADRRGSVLT